MIFTKYLLLCQKSAAGRSESQKIRGYFPVLREFRRRDGS